MEVLDRPIRLPSLVPSDEPAAARPHAPDQDEETPAPGQPAPLAPSEPAPARQTLSRLELAKALEELAERSGGYQAIRAALDFLAN
jgi:hypothetical protein